MYTWIVTVEFLWKKIASDNFFLLFRYTTPP